MSIQKQGVPKFEIIAAGQQHFIPVVEFVTTEHWHDTGEVNRMRNLLCSRAAQDFVVLIADHMELADGWYEAIKDADCLDIAASRITMPDGSRAIDWAYEVKLGSRQFPYPLDYDEWTTKAYVSGNLMVLRKRAWERIKFDESLKQGAGDFGDFCLRASRLGYKLGVFPMAQARSYATRLADGTGDAIEPSQKIVASFRQALAAGEEAFKAQNYRQTIESLTRTLGIVSDESRALSLLGWSHYFIGQYPQAIKFLDQAVVADADNHFAFRGRGWAALQTGDYKRAVEFLTRSLDFVTTDKRDKWIETLRGRAWANFHVGNYDCAISDFSALREKSSANETGLLQDIYRGLGWSCYREGMLSEAAAHFKNAIRALESGNPDLLQDARHGLELASGLRPPLNQAPAKPQGYLTITNSTRYEDISNRAAPLTLRRRLAAVINPIKRRLRS